MFRIRGVTDTAASANVALRTLLCPRSVPGLRFSSTAPATITNASFWKSLVPKPFRKQNRKSVRQRKSKKEWNPATFYIVMFLFIGSMSIQMIALRNSTERYLRQSSIRIGLLREVVRKIQNGEDVDVEKELGTGDPQKEADWEELLQAIERGDTVEKQLNPEKQQASAPQKQSRSTVADANIDDSSPPSQQPKQKPTNFANFF